MSKSISAQVSSKSFFPTICGLVIVAALIYFAVAINVDPQIVLKLSPMARIIGVLLSVVLGTLLVNSSSSLILQMVGFSITPAVLGIVSAPWWASVNLNTAYEAGLLVVVAATVMGVLSGLFPKFFIKIRGILFGSLIALIIVGLLGSFVFSINMTLYHVAAIVIFMGLLGYDLAVARRAAPTLQNAFIIASSVFLDLLNLFMHIYSAIDD